MSRIIVQTDDGREVAQLQIDPTWSPSATSRHVYGRQDGGPLGWLGRALEDADVIQEGGDPERPSEKAMRLLDERRRREILGEA